MAIIPVHRRRAPISLHLANVIAEFLVRVSELQSGGIHKSISSTKEYDALVPVLIDYIGAKAGVEESVVWSEVSDHLHELAKDGEHATLYDVITWADEKAKELRPASPQTRGRIGRTTVGAKKI
jgi:hypothetical protein